MRYTHRFSYTDFQEIKRLIKDYAGSLGKSIGASMVSGALELWKTSYEKLEENYKEIMHTRYTYKFNEAYALDYNSFIYYDIDHKKNKLSFNLASKLALNNLSTYLCLDELRGAGNEIDARYFNYARSRYTESDVEIRELNLDVKEEKEVYEIYKRSSLANVASGKPKYPINSYQKAVDIINKLKKGIFNTEDSDNSHRNLSRELVEALDIIGNNNIKGIYVGCKEFQEYKNSNNKKAPSKLPPRLVGRLATTIVMEDGLYIG